VTLDQADALLDWDTDGVADAALLSLVVMLAELDGDDESNALCDAGTLIDVLLVGVTVAI
jgi:hypothetical protein